MGKSYMFILICVITSCSSQEETVFHCSAKPGCQITHCDPLPLGLVKLGFNFEEDINAREFPITCQGKSSSKRQENLSPIVYSNLQDITHIKQDIKAQADERRNENEEVQKLKKELSEMRKENSELKKALDKVEQKVAVLNKNQRQQANTRTTDTTPPRQVTRQITTIQTVTKQTGNAPCEYEKDSICYWTEVNKLKTITYYDANKLCGMRNSILAVIPSYEVYEKIYSILRSKMSGSNSKFFWIQLQISPMTGDIIPVDAYTRWSPNSPKLGNTKKGSTHVYLAVNPKPEVRIQGMVNYLPTNLLNGMVCLYEVVA